MTPHRCAILAIDPGKASGWSIWLAGRIVTWGPCDPGSELSIVEAARTYERDESLPLVVVAEKWSAGGWRSAASMIGLGAQWGRWEGALRLAGHPMRRVVRVYPQTWRSAMLRPGKRGVTSEEWKHLAATRAGWVTSEIMADHNVADAVCIGEWATRAAIVGDRMPKRRAPP